MENITVSFSPNTSQLAIIEKWLAKEYQIKKKGFYVNWHNSAIPSHGANRLAIISKGGRPIGFMTWFLENEKVAEIQLTEIESGQRKRGYCKYLLDAVLEKLSQSGIRVARLHCQPAASESVWKKLGFSKFPDFKAFLQQNSKEGKHLYKILENTAEVLNNPNGESNLIELWAGQSWEITTEIPQWSWHPKFISHSHCLETPIIVPAHYEWRMKWTSNGVAIHDDKIKYFSKSRLDFSDFLIIDELPIKA
jgi:hypothetical protein